MTNLSELKARYAELGAEIERLEAKPIPTNDGPLTEAPEVDATYWVVSDLGGRVRGTWASNSFDCNALASGLAFPTREAVDKFHRRRLAEQKLRTIIAKHAPGWKADWADWADYEQQKAWLYRDHRNRRWSYSTQNACQAAGIIYFPPDLFQTILSEMGEATEDLL